MNAHRERSARRAGGFARIAATFAIGAAATSAPAWAHAEEPERQLVQEVFLTELVYPQEAGELQLTFAPAAGIKRADRRFEAPFRLEYGLTDAWQVEAGWTALSERGGLASSDASGVGDLALGTKYSVLDIADSGWHVAGAFDVTIPIADAGRGLGEGVLEYEPALMIGVDLPAWHHAHAFTELAIAFRERTHGARDADGIGWSSGFVVPAGALRLSLECTVEDDRWSGGDERVVLLTPGVIWPLAGAWELGLGVPVGLSGDADDVGVIAMVTRELSLFGGGA